MAETRSSQSPTATLSDFVIGSFPLCSVEATPFTGLSKVGDAITYELTVKNTGAMEMFLEDVSDSLLGNLVVDGVVQAPSGPITNINVGGFDLDSPLEPGDSLTVFVTRTVQPTDDDPTVSTTTFVFNDEADFSGEQITDSAVNSVNLFQPSVTLDVTV